MNRCARVCGKAIESRTRIVGECEMYKEELNVYEGNRGMRHGGVWYTRSQRESDRYPRRYQVDGGHRRRNRKR